MTGSPEDQSDLAKDLFIVGRMRRAAQATMATALQMGLIPYQTSETIDKKELGNDGQELYLRYGFWHIEKSNLGISAGVMLDSLYKETLIPYISYARPLTLDYQQSLLFSPLYQPEVSGYSIGCGMVCEVKLSNADGRAVTGIMIRRSLYPILQINIRTYNYWGEHKVFTFDRTFFLDQPLPEVPDWPEFCFTKAAVEHLDEAKTLLLMRRMYQDTFPFPSGVPAQEAVAKLSSLILGL